MAYVHQGSNPPRAMSRIGMEWHDCCLWPLGRLSPNHLSTRDFLLDLPRQALDTLRFPWRLSEKVAWWSALLDSRWSRRRQLPASIGPLGGPSDPSLAGVVPTNGGTARGRGRRPLTRAGARSVSGADPSGPVGTSQIRVDEFPRPCDPSRPVATRRHTRRDPSGPVARNGRRPGGTHRDPSGTVGTRRDSPDPARTHTDAPANHRLDPPVEACVVPVQGLWKSPTSGDLDIEGGGDL